MQQFKWNVLQEDTPSNFIDALLENRNIDQATRLAFLMPDFNRHTHSASLFKDMERAVKLIFKMMESGEKITIHGDYDADGVSGSALLYLALQEITKELDYPLELEAFLPDREKDGYGIAMHTIDRLAQEETKLLITVDCGISNVAEIARAYELGMQVVICDHHQLAETLPEKAAIIHPLVPGEQYPNKKLCGTGVAYKLACGLFEEARKRGAGFADGYEKWYLDFVAIATITDVMPVLGENRVLEHFGLKVLNKTKRYGLIEIINFSRTELGSIDTQAIGFQIGPRLNAAGRIKSARIAFNALIAQTETEARKHAEELERLNRERRAISDRAYKEALHMVHELLRATDEAGEKPPKSLVVWNELWNPGIVGLVAGKLVREFGLPSFALTKVADHFVGSGRTAGGLHLVEAMNSAGDIYIKHGGHPQACGLSLEENQLKTFAKAIETFAICAFGDHPPVPELTIDVHLPLNQITFELLAELETLRPYGEGNREPYFLAKSETLLELDTLGKEGKHLRLVAQGANGTIKGIGFNVGHLASELDLSKKVDIVFKPSINEWNGRKDLQFELIDLRTSL